jgi:hypothetical protein
VTEDIWGDKAKRLLRSEMVRRGVSYEELAERLEAMGVHDTPVNIRNKVYRGKFMASFMIQCLEAMDIKVLRLEET